MMHEVAVTGAGCVCACGTGLGEAFSGLASGAARTVFPENFQAEGIFALEPSVKQDRQGPVFAVTHGELWPERYHTAGDTLALARMAAAEALSGLPERSGRLGVCLGSTVGGSLYFIRSCDELRRGEDFSAHARREMRDYFNCNPALALGRELAAEGPLLTVTNACASGADAIGLACRWLEAGLCDYALAGGADALSYVPYVGFSRLMLYDAGRCRPFSTRRKGLNLGEGAGILLLERKEHAEKRGTVPLGFICGYANVNDAHHHTAPHPEGRGLASAINAAMGSFGHGAAGDLAFVNVHGTGTIDNDLVESRVVSAILPDVPIWACKGETGHTLGASGALEAVFSLTALAQKYIPAKLDYELEEMLHPALIRDALHLEKKLALSVSLGFGGANSALLLRAAGEYM